MTAPAPVDVLGNLASMALHHGDKWEAIHNAVAELIEALRLSDEWIREASHKTGMRATATLDRNRAALARVGGTK